MTVQKDYYSIQKILQIMKDYHRNIQNITDMEQEDMQSVGVAQYGIEASMPKAGGISQVVENEAIRRVDSSRFWSIVSTDIAYIQDRLHKVKVTDDKFAMVLHMRLDGYSVEHIGRQLGMDRSNAYRILRRVVKVIKD